MRVIVTGSTGYIGKAVLEQCLSDSGFSSVVALSRRDPGVSHAKLTVILHDDFTKWDEDTLSKLRDADACIYCLGTNVPIKPKELNRKVNFDYALSFATTLARNHTKTFRFVYLSGALPEKDPEKKLWFLSENRKMRGGLENALIRLDSEQADNFQVFIARPGFVQPEGTMMRAWLMNTVANAIMLPGLIGGLVWLAKFGNDSILVENSSLKELGKN